MSFLGRVYRKQLPQAASAERMTALSERRVGPPRAAWPLSCLSVVVYALSGAALAFPLAAGASVLACGIGAGTGAFFGFRLARSSLRLTAIVGAATLGLLSVAGIHHLLVNTPWLAWLLGPASALRWADTLYAAVASLLIAGALRVSAQRIRLCSVFEVAAVSTAFAQLVVAHRDGAINRPFEFADPMIAVGVDPTIALLTIGAVAALVIVLVLMVESSLARVAIHLGVAVVIVASILYGARVVGLPQPGPDGLGLRAGQDQRGGRTNKEPAGKGGARGRRSNDELEFRDNYSSSFNRAPVAVVLLHDDYSPPSGVYYFRQSAFSLYNGRRLVEAAGVGVDRDLAAYFPAARTVISEVPNQRGDRAAVDTTVALLADHKRPFGLESPLALEPAFNPDPSRFRRIYRVSSASLTSDFYALLGRTAGDAAWSPDTWRHYSNAPTDPRYRELAVKIEAGLRPELREDPTARALAISSWLSKEGLYSLRSSHAKAADPTADFLFGDKTGYCVHFSHAAVYLMRALGLPTRIAAGYVVEEAARRGGSTIVLSGENSHSWPELYLRGVGWVVVDVVPERSLDPPPPPPDPDLQRLLGELARAEKPLPYPGAQMFEPAARLAWAAVKTFGRVVMVAVLLFLLSLYLIKCWRRWIPAFATASGLPRAIYRAQLDRLSELRFRRRLGESRESFARRLASVCPSFSPLTEAHLRTAFGGQSAIEASVLRSLSVRIKSELHAAIPIWKRVLGALTPWSWLGSR